MHSSFSLAWDFHSQPDYNTWIKTFACTQILQYNLLALFSNLIKLENKAETISI